MNNANANETFTGTQDARLRDEYATLQLALQRVAQSIARAQHLRTTLHDGDDPHPRYLAYPTQEDSGLSRLNTLLTVMQHDAGEIAQAQAQRVATQHQQQQQQETAPAPRRLSIKMEQAPLQFVQAAAEPETVAAETTPEGVEGETEMSSPDEGHEAAGVEDDTDATDDGTEDMVDSENEGVEVEPEPPTTRSDAGVAAPPTPRKAPALALAATVATPPPRGSEKPVEASESSLVEQATACLRVAEAITVPTDEDTTPTFSGLLKELARITDAVNRAYSFPRSSKPRGPVPSACLKVLAQALDRAMRRLRQSGVTLGLVQSVLTLHKTTTVIYHPQLQEIVKRPQRILHGTISRFAETLGGAKRQGGISKSSENDELAQECFALAMDLLTVTTDEERDAKIDDVLHALKQSFRPVLLHKPSAHMPRVRSDGRQFSAVVWAGRVMLLAAHIVAHTIATHTRAVLKAEPFLKIIDQIGLRHPLFPQFFRRVRTMVSDAPFARRPTAPLDLPSESKRIANEDTSV